MPARKKKTRKKAKKTTKKAKSKKASPKKRKKRKKTTPTTKKRVTKTMKKSEKKEDIKKQLQEEVKSEKKEAVQDNNSMAEPEKPEEKNMEKKQEGEDKKQEETTNQDAKKPEESQKDPIKEAGIPSTVTSFSMLDVDKPASKPPADTSSLKTDTPQPEKEKTIIPEQKKENKDEEEREDKISSDEVKKWLKDVRPDTTKEVQKGGGSIWGKVFVTFFILALLGAVAGGVYYYENGFSQIKNPFPRKETGDQPQSMEKEPTPTEEVTPTPETVSFSDYSVEVLNGSGVAGEAGRVEGFISDLEFADIATSNADSYDHTTTTIQLAEGTPKAVFDKLKEALTDEYIVEQADEPLESDSEYDIIITVGERKAS